MKPSAGQMITMHVQHYIGRNVKRGLLRHFPITLSECLFTSPRRGPHRGEVKSDAATSLVQPYRNPPQQLTAMGDGGRVV
jgi:hypothetical protein